MKNIRMKCHLLLAQLINVLYGINFQEHMMCACQVSEISNP